MAQDNIIKFTELVDRANTVLSKHITILDTAASNLDLLNQSYAKMPSEYSAAIKKNLEVQEKKAKSDKEIIGLENQKNQAIKSKIPTLNQLVRFKKAEQAATEKGAIQQAKMRFETGETNKRVKEAAILSSKLATEYQKLVVRMNQAGATVQSLNAKKLQGNTLSKAEQAQLRKSEIEFRKYQKAVLGADASIGRFNRNVGNYPKGLMAAAGAARSFASALGFTSGLILAVQIMKDSFKTIKEFNSGLLNVSKTTGLVGNDLTKLSDDIIGLSGKLGTVGTKSLLQYATVAGQLGVKGSENILAFTEALAKLETATDIVGEEGGANIARLLTLTDGGVQNVKDFGDELVILGNNFAATEGEILDNATAIAQNTGVYKLGRQEALAYAVATKAVGIESEITGSTIGKTLGVIEKAIRNGKGLEQISRLTGIAQNELGEAFKENSGQVLTNFIKGLNEVQNAGGSVNKELDELGITSVRNQRVIGTLASAGYKTLEQALIDVTSAAGSLNQEFETASGKLENQINRIGIAYDNFVLNVEDGKGILGTAVKAIADFYVRNFERANVILNENISLMDRAKIAANTFWGNITFGKLRPFQEQTEILMANSKAMKENTEGVEELYKAYVKQHGSLAPLTKEHEDYNKVLLETFGISNDTKNKEEEKITRLADLRKQISDLNEAIENSDILDKEGIRTKQESIKTIQKQIDALLGTGKAQKKATREKVEAITLEKKETNSLVKELEAQIDVLEKVKKLYTETSPEARFLAEQIKFLQEVLEVKPDASKGLQDIEDFFKNREHDEELMKRLKKATDDFLGSFQTDVFQDAGLGSLQTFFDGTFETLLAGADTTGERFAVTFNAIAESAQEAFNFISQIGQQNFEEQYYRLEQQRDIAIQFAGESTAAREQIEEQYEARRKAIQARQAKSQKTLAIFNTITNTAQGVVSALAMFPPNPVLAGIIAGIGAAQLAVIASQKIPEFKEGVRDFSGGMAVVGDGGVKEVIRTDKGVFETPNKDTLVNLPKGADVFKNRDDYYNSVMNDLGILPSVPKVEVNGITKNEMDSILSRHFSNLSTNNISIDKNGIKTYISKGHGRTVNMNNRVTHKGINV